MIFSNPYNQVPEADQTENPKKCILKVQSDQQGAAYYQRNR